MGWWQRLFGDRPTRADDSSQQAPDYRGVDDARLEVLWDARDRLTEAAQAALEAECVRRGLLEEEVPAARARKGDTHEPHDAAPRDPEPRGPRPSAEVLVVSRLGILLETVPGRHVLLHVPRWNPTPLGFPEGLELDAIVVCNGGPGVLETTAIAAHYGVAPEAIFATPGEAIDRAPGRTDAVGRRLAGRLRRGNLTLRPLPEHGALRATWHGDGRDAIVGLPLAASMLGVKPTPRWYVGTLPAQGGDLALSMLLTAAHAAPLLGQRVPTVHLLGEGGSTPIHYFARGTTPGEGLELSGDPCPVAAPAVDTLAAALASVDAAVRDGCIDLDVAHEAWRGAMMLGELAAAGAIAAAARERHGASSDAAHMVAQTLLLDGAVEQAAAATSASQVGREAAITDACVLAARGDRAAAASVALAACAADPEDVDLAIVAVRMAWLAGRIEDARACFATGPTGLGAARAGDLAALLDLSPPPAADPMATRPALPHLAAAAITMARHVPIGEHQRRWVERGVRLDPLHPLAAALGDG